MTCPRCGHDRFKKNGTWKGRDGKRIPKAECCSCGHNFRRHESPSASSPAPVKHATHDAREAVLDPLGLAQAFASAPKAVAPLAEPPVVRQYVRPNHADEPTTTEEAEETVPRQWYDDAVEHAKFLSEEAKRLRERPAAYLIGEMIATGFYAVVDIWKEREKWKVGKR